MIQLDATKGELNCRGPLDTIICEYTLLTRVLLREMRTQLGEERADKMFAGIGQIAVKDIDEIRNVTSMFEEVSEALDDEV